MDIRNMMNKNINRLKNMKNTIGNRVGGLRERYAFLKQPKYMALNLILVVALLVQGTFAWSHLTQNVNGALLYIHETYPVELHKYERQADGTYTEIPMEDVGFVLYKENGEQIESVYWTDEDGRIYVDLPVGDYFWKEIYYNSGWGPDIDENGNSILTYPFEVTEDITEEEPLVVEVYNLPLEADLEVEKIIVNLDGSELSESQLEQVFEFYIYFSDEGTYKYYITEASSMIASYIDSDYRSFASRVYEATGVADGTGSAAVSGEDDTDEGIEWLEITSRETIYLKHGQVAVIQDLPVGITYSVHETRVVNYYTDSVGHLGNIVYGENRAVFTNTYDPVFGSILVSKEVVNADGSELTQQQLEKEFLFTAWIDGEEISFVIKHGEEHLIEDIPVGTKYRVEEFDYIDDEYYATVLVYEGEILGEYEHYLPFVNVYDPVDELGDLIVRKLLVSPDGEDVELDYDLEFTFEVTFEYEDGTVDTTEFTLTGDEFGDPSLWKIFEDIPVGTKYTIREIGTGGYLPESDVIEGDIAGKIYDAGLDEDLSEVYDLLAEVEEVEAIDVVADKYALEEQLGDRELEESPLADVDGELVEEGLVEALEVEEKIEVEDFVEIDEAESEELEELLRSNQVVTFYNRPEITKTLEISKEVIGVVPFVDEDKEFLMRLFVDGELLEEFTLTAGEMKSFEVPLYATYEVWEEDYLGDGYSQLVVSGYGTIWQDMTEVTVINEYIWEEVEIEGEKTWTTDEDALVHIPDSIVVRLMLDEVVVEELIVEPNEDGLWLYSFTAPKYDLYGEEYEYTVVEAPIDYFYPEYDEEYNIHNNFVESVLVLLPVLEKQVLGEDVPEEKFGFVLRGFDGAPMPVGTVGDELVFIQYGQGEQALGEIRYTEPGVYYYTIRELMGESKDWKYDTTVYRLEVLVEDINGQLAASYTLYNGDEVVERAIFVNEYDPVKEDVDEDELDEDELDEDELDEDELEEDDEDDLDLDDSEDEVSQANVVVSGNKTWVHGDNPEDQYPNDLVVYLTADGEVIRATLINDGNNWSYSFTVSKFDEYGVEIEYSIEEELVPYYVASGEGYNLVNTYDANYGSGDAGGSTDDTDNSSGYTAGTKTGDYTNVIIWILSMILSFGTWVAVVYGRASRN